jgi:uncharacterized protein (TIGR03435 family)
MLTIINFLLLAQAVPSDARQPKFEVASVKPSKDPVGIDMYILAGGKMRAKNLNLHQLIESAWEVHPDRIDGPSSLYYSRYDIEAVPPQDDLKAGGPKVQMFGKEIPRVTLQRLRSLVIERFNLKYHFEDRTAAYYDLVLDRKNGSLSEKPFNINFPLQCRPDRITSFGRPMSELAYDLGLFYLQTEVNDKTGLAGNYAYDFKFEPVNGASATSDRPLLIDALKETGLRLIQRKGPARYLVIDSFAPTEN